MKQWLLILGPVFIAAVLLHGYWSMRANRHNLRMSLDKSFQSKPGEEGLPDELALLKAELPNGGARVIKAPEQDPLDLARNVPVLMESVIPPEERTADPVVVAPEDSSPATEDRDEVANDSQVEVRDESVITAVDVIAPAELDEPIRAEPPSRVESPLGNPVIANAPPARASKPEKFVILNIMADGPPFAGQQLLETLLKLNMTHGEMNIFHRMGDHGFSEFSLTNAVEPGTFDPAAMDSLATPGVTMFMRVHELADPLAAYDEMMAVACGIANELGGEVQDELRTAMTEDAVEQCRQGISDFQYRYSA